MSRIGKNPITVPAGVEVKVDGSTVTVKGPKGTLTNTFNADMIIKLEGTEIIVDRPSENKMHKSLHGLTRTLLNNMVVGVNNGFEKVLEINGTGYRAQLQGKTLVVNAGYSHPVNLEIPEGLTVTVPNPTEVHVAGCDKQLVGQFAANVRIIRKPEPYKGKGIKFVGEIIRRKSGKSAGAK